MATPRIQSVVKAFGMLQAFSTEEEWVTCAELIRRTGLPESSGYRIISTLEHLGAIVRDRRGRYRPSLLLVALSGRVPMADMIAEAATGVLPALARRVSATAHIGVLEDGMVTYIGKAEGDASVPTPTQLGAQLEAYCSAIGKVLLAALPEDELAEFMTSGDLVPLTERTITDPNDLRRELDSVRRSGFAIDDEEVAPGLKCIAVPIRDSHGRTVAALSVSDRAHRQTAERLDEVRQVLAQNAMLIGAKLQTKPAKAA